MAKVTLGEVAAECRESCRGDKSGLPAVGLEHLTPGQIRLSSWAVNTENTFTKLFRRDDMLFGRRRAYLKKAAQAPFDGICSGDITVIRARPGKLLPELLPFIIQNDDLFDFAVGRSDGSLSPRVKWENLANYTFELPPLAEQKKLAEVLWAISDTIQAYQDLLTKTEELVKARFAEMLGDGMYPISLLINLIKEGAGVSYGIVQPGDDGTGDMGVLRPVDIVDGKISVKSIKYIDRAIGEGFKKTELTGDELLITVRGTTGTTALTDDKFAGMNVTRGIAVIRYDRRKINPVYLNAYFNTDKSQRYIQEHTKGATLQQINLSDLRLQEIPVPPMAQQEKMSAFITQADQSKSALQRTITSLQETKRSLAAEALCMGRKE